MQKTKKKESKEDIRKRVELAILFLGDSYEPADIAFRCKSIGIDLRKLGRRNEANTYLERAVENYEKAADAETSSLPRAVGRYERAAAAEIAAANNVQSWFRRRSFFPNHKVSDKCREIAILYRDAAECLGLLKNEHAAEDQQKEAQFIKLYDLVRLQESRESPTLIINIK